MSPESDPLGESEKLPSAPGASIPRSAGLCARCVHARAIVTRRSSTFVLCEASRTDSRLDRYPRLPVLRCHAFESQKPHEHGEPGESAAS